WRKFNPLCPPCNTTFGFNRYHQSDSGARSGESEPNAEGVVMDRGRFLSSEGGVRKGLAIASLLILSSLTIGSRPAQAQACIVNPDGTAMCTIPTQIGTFTVNANGNTGTFSGTCPNGQTFTGHVGQGSTTDQIIASSTIAFSGSCFPGGGSAQNAVSLQNSVQ